MRALIVDDSRTARNVLSQTLRALGYEVTLAADGREAFASLERDGRPDVALVDWEMPVLDGLGFVHLARRDERFRDLPILMVTTQTRQTQVAVALEEGADEYVMKPFTREIIAEKLALLGLASAAALAPESQTGELVATETTLTAAPAAPPASAAPIRVLLVDDSAVVRKLLTAALADDPELGVPTTAADGRIALDMLPGVDPDVVVLDLEMPNLNGMETLQALRRTHPRLPVIIFSGLAEPGAAATVEALLLGADDYLTKPDTCGDFDAVKRSIRSALVPKVKELAARRLGRRPAKVAPSEPRSVPRSPPRAVPVGIVVVAASTGGPNALAALLPAFAADCSAPIVIVQHMPPLFTAHLAKRLEALLCCPAREASDADTLQPGHILVAPGGFHLTMVRQGHEVRVRTTAGPAVNNCRPSADILFAAAVEVYGPAVLAVVLTGMGRDGLDGCRRVREAGGQVLVQNEASSVVWGMPGHVAQAGLSDAVLPLTELGPEIARRLRRACP